MNQNIRSNQYTRNDREAEADWRAAEREEDTDQVEDALDPHDVPSIDTTKLERMAKEVWRKYMGKQECLVFCDHCSSMIEVQEVAGCMDKAARNRAMVAAGAQADEYTTEER
jgi:hypothetical protein